MCEFIVEHRARFGVAPICAVLSEHGWKIAPENLLRMVVEGAVETGTVG